MKRKSKILLSFIIILLIISFNVVNGHSIELDPDSSISFPFIIFNGEGNINVSSLETNYTLYYQAIEIPDETYNQIKNIQSEGEEELDKITVEMEALDSECDNLKTIYDEAFEKYNSLLEAGTEGAELENAKAEYDTAKTNYENKVKEYNTKVEENNAKVEEINQNIDELTPMYNDEKWQETVDGSFKIDVSTFNGTKAFALWARLIREDGTIIYDETICTTEGTMEDEISVIGVKLNKNELSLVKGSNYNLVASITPENATDKTLIWSSNNEEVATVENGKVTAISPGTAIITVKTNDGEFEDTCEVTVTNEIIIDDPNNNDNADNNDNNTNNNTKDPTTADGELPQTGKSFVVLGIVGVLVVISIILYRKMKYHNF